jgi:hypothetical protein
MRTCFVHIGMLKTGSTAIQTAFYGYNDGKTAMLRLDKPNHTFPILMIFSAKRDWAAKRSGAKFTNLGDHIRTLQDSISGQFQANKSNFIISGEGISSHLTVAEIATLKAFLSKWFDDIRIIIYIRDPGSYLRSMFQQTAKTTAIALDLGQFKPRYHDRLIGWLQVFDRDKVDAVLFDRHEFEGGNILCDFAQRVGMDVTRARKPAENRSLRAEGFALTYVARGAIASGKLSWMQWVRQRADLYMTREYGQQDFDFSNALYEIALANQTADIAWAEQFLQRPFPARRRADNAIVFGSNEDILQYATECRAGFETWKRRTFGWHLRLSYLARSLRHRVSFRK